MPVGFSSVISESKRKERPYDSWYSIGKFGRIEALTNVGESLLYWMVFEP